MLKGQMPVQAAEAETLRRLLADGKVEPSVAIDGGAHIGSWTAIMAGYFAKTIAFEPTAFTFGILTENLAGYPNVELRNQALMQHAGRVNVVQPTPKHKRLTSRFCVESTDGDIVSIAIDDLSLDRCGLIKLDLEGAEWQALMGAQRTIRQCRPVLVIEIRGLSRRFGHSEVEVQSLALSFGYELAFEAGVDKVFVPK